MIYFKRFIAFTFVLFSLTSVSYANPPLFEALAQKRPVAIFNVNDVFTDADSIQAFIESLLLGSQHKDCITQYFITDDEANAETLKTVQKSIADKACLEEGKHEPIRAHYYTEAPFTNPLFGFRAQDTATVLFPLADKLGVTINIIQGNASTNPTYNPYFGNFGVGYCATDQGFVKRIHQKTGSAAVIEGMKKEIEAGKLIYVLNGGSFKLLADIQEQAPHLLPFLDVTVMGFRQPMNFPPFDNPSRKWAPSWNEGIDREAVTRFVAFASNPQNPQLRALRIVDSNTVNYAMVCDGQTLPLYKEYMNKLMPFLTEEAYSNLIDAEHRHETWSGFKTKFMDPTLVFDCFGKAPIPKVETMIVESPHDFNIRPGAGFVAHIPAIGQEHPYSHPRKNPGEDDTSYSLRAKNYTGQIERVTSYQKQLMSSHNETWELLETK